VFIDDAFGADLDSASTDEHNFDLYTPV
jgi:hypothetical protein